VFAFGFRGTVGGRKPDHGMFLVSLFFGILIFLKKKGGCDVLFAFFE